MSVVLEIKNLNKSYGNTHALKDFSYTMTPGVYGLLGPNGAGKSTLMHLLTDNLTPDKGTILFNDQPVKGMGTDFLKALGYMPQQQGVYEEFTANRFLYYMSTLKGLTKREAREQVPRLLERVNLKDHGNQRLGSFSGGMKQRILIAQALLGNPQVLIFDEPTAGLDPRERIRIRNLISEISFEKIILIATHVVSDIEFIAQEVLLLQKGTLIDSGSPHSLMEKVKGYIFEIQAQSTQLMEVSEKYKVGNIVKDGDDLYLRIVSDQAPKGFEFTDVRPTLEDVYLYCFDEGEIL